MSEEKNDEIFIKNLKEKIHSKSYEPIVPERLNTPDWRNPDDVKTYLDTLYIEYSFQCKSFSNLQ